MCVGAREIGQHTLKLQSVTLLVKRASTQMDRKLTRMDSFLIPALRAVRGDNTLAAYRRDLELYLEFLSGRGGGALPQ